MQWKKTLKQCLLMAGILLWIGVTGPEIYIDSGIGCLVDENGEALTKEETEQLLETWFYNTKEEQSDEVQIVYKSMFMQWLQRNSK